MGERKFKIPNSLFYIIQIFILIIVIQYLESAHYQDLTPQSKYDHILWTSYYVNSRYYTLTLSFFKLSGKVSHKKKFWRFFIQ